MIGALWILAATVVMGLVLYLLDRRTRGQRGGDEPAEKPSPDSPQPASDVCCGQHIICEKEATLAAATKPVVYYEDQELDEYRGIAPDDYTEEQIEQFRDILYTLRPEEISAWAISIQQRQINLPTPVKDELIMLAAEARTNKKQDA